MSNYKCVFNFDRIYKGPGNPHEVVICDGDPFNSLSAFKGGFWITPDLKFTSSSHVGKYWIPPSQIRYIEKIRKENY